MNKTNMLIAIQELFETYSKDFEHRIACNDRNNAIASVGSMLAARDMAIIISGDQSVLVKYMTEVINNIADRAHKMATTGTIQ